MNWLDGYFSKPICHPLRFEGDESAVSSDAERDHCIVDRCLGFRARLHGDPNEPVLVQVQEATLLTPLVLASWLAHRPFAIVPPDQAQNSCARIVGAREVLTDADLENVAPDCRDDEICGNPWREDACAGIIFSSGSTGDPKGVRHSLPSLIGSARLFLKHFGIGAGDKVNCLAAPHVMSGYRALLLPLISDVQVEFMHSAQEKGFELVMRVLAGDWVICGPHFVRLVAASASWLKGERLPHALLVTGDRLDDETRAQVVQELGLPVINYYGLTETGGIVMAEKPDQPRPGLLPPACSGVVLHTREATESPGLRELGVEGPNNFLGYCGQSIERHPIVWTGDLVEEPEKDHFRLVGRLDGAIKAPDTTWLYPDRLEKWLRSQPDVADAVVRPLPAAGALECWIDWSGEADKLRARIEADLAPAYCPRFLHPSTILRSTLGKLRTVVSHDETKFPNTTIAEEHP